jgi:phosphoadenosine phosphosulfate reductase
MLDYSELVERAVSLLQRMEPPGGYYGGFSGGKDSCVIKHLAAVAGVRVEWHYHMSIDPPELVRFIREHHSDVIVDRPKMQIFKEVEKRGMPWAKARWCCALIKERHGKGRVKILGVRGSESARRLATWDEVSGDVVAPIFRWEDDHVWEHIRSQGILYCSLYDEGFERLGCVGCPLGGQKKREMDFARWPRYGAAWRNACERLWNVRGKEWAHKQQFADWKEHWEWWRYSAHGTRKTEALCGQMPLENMQF